METWGSERCVPDPGDIAFCEKETQPSHVRASAEKVVFSHQLRFFGRQDLSANLVSVQMRDGCAAGLGHAGAPETRQATRLPSPRRPGPPRPSALGEGTGASSGSGMSRGRPAGPPAATAPGSWVRWARGHLRSVRRLSAPGAARTHCARQVHTRALRCRGRAPLAQRGHGVRTCAGSPGLGRPCRGQCQRAGTAPRTQSSPSS